MGYVWHLSTVLLTNHTKKFNATKFKIWIVSSLHSHLTLKTLLILIYTFSFCQIRQKIFFIREKMKKIRIAWYVHFWRDNRFETRSFFYWWISKVRKNLILMQTQYNEKFEKSCILWYHTHINDLPISRFK